MVYRGKPGASCILCRKRRIPCDKRRPSCSQCLKAHRLCPGYQDPKAVRFCHQTDEVVQKVKTPGSKSTTPEEDLVQVLPPPTSNDDRALSHIFTYWVGTTQSPGMIWFLPNIISASPSSVALQATIKALGLASISRMHMVPKLRHAAREAYGEALRAINDALLDPKLVKSDGTLGAVFLLSSYEMITVNLMNFKSTWVNHIVGAASLLELRGEEQLNSISGLELFTVVRVSNEISSIVFRSTRHHSSRIEELAKLAKTKRDANTLPVEALYETLAKISDLSTRFDKVSKSSDEKLGLEYLTEALHLDITMRLWALSPPPAWHYTVVNEPPTRTPAHAFFPHGDKYHIYNSSHIAASWNQYRQTRMILTAMVRSISLHLWDLQQRREEQSSSQQRSSGSSEYEQMVLQCNAVIDEMLADIRASVSIHFNTGPQGVTTLHWLLWPLFVSGLCTRDIIIDNDNKGEDSEAKYGWIQQALDMIAKITGFQEAISFAQIIRDGNTRGIIPGV